MTPQDIERLKKQFNDYVFGYYSSDPDVDWNIRFKEAHTWQVFENTIRIGHGLGLTGSDLLLAETIALLHDIGRFEQYKKYKTFYDSASENHAKLGLAEISRHDILSCCTPDEKRLIKQAIAHHNAMAIPDIDNEKALLFIKLIRDADKLDIWKVFLNYYHGEEKENISLIIGLPDTPAFSESIVADLKQGRAARLTDMKTINDYKLIQLGWMFDLNFPVSFQIAKEWKIVERLGQALPQTPEIEAVLKRALDYVDLRAKG